VCRKGEIGIAEWLYCIEASAGIYESTRLGVEDTPDTYGSLRYEYLNYQYTLTCPPQSQHRPPSLISLLFLSTPTVNAHNKFVRRDQEPEFQGGRVRCVDDDVERRTKRILAGGAAHPGRATHPGRWSRWPPSLMV
jgi:hypothetical protein